MTTAHRIQQLILAIESGRGRRLLWLFVGCLALAGLVVWYDVWAYHGFSAPEAMDSAQVARNLAGGHGFATQSIVPLRLFLLQRKNHDQAQSQPLFTGQGAFYPDLANAPVYPVVLAGLMKWTKPDWQVETKKSFWAYNGRFQRYKPEFLMALFNQFLLLLAVIQTFYLAKKWFDAPVAWMSALVTLGSSELWQFSISGLSTLLLLVIFLGLAWILSEIDASGRVEAPNQGRLVRLAVAAGVVTGLGMMTRYAFGWLIFPVLAFLVWFGGTRRTNLMLAAGGIFAVIIAPWLVRNYLISGQLFGTAGFALLEGTGAFPGLTLLQSANPAMDGAEAHGGWLFVVLHKLLHNALAIFQNDLPHLAGWASVLFFAGLLLGFRNPAPRRLRYFALMCLSVLLPVQALGRTWLSDATPDFNSENLLVLLTPIVVIFGTAFFLTLVDQLALPNLETRYVVTILVALTLCLPFLATFLPPRPRVLAYPPYYPPEIQKVCSWLGPDELMMSDMPWAVAWYGQHPCISLSRDTQDNFSAVNDYFQPVKGVYLTTLTLDGKFFSNVLRSEHGGWNRLVQGFVIRDAVDNALSANPEDALSRIRVEPKSQTDFLEGFPLRTAKSLDAGLFFTDRPRWSESH